jgi:septum site-determining protein MinC
MSYAIIRQNVQDQHRMNSEGVTIKGIRQGLLVTVGSGEWDREIDELQAHLDENPAFFRGGRVALDVQDRALTHDQIEDVRSMMARHQIEMWALTSGSSATRSAARELGLVVELESTGEAERVSEEAPDSSDGAVVVRRTVRSGQTVRHPGHVIVIGDVNPGAEVVAGGDIVVWGRLRGMVHAGALGSEDAIICALELAPTQLRIGGRIARSPEERLGDPVPEKASVREGQIVAVPWPGE